MPEIPGLGEVKVVAISDVSPADSNPRNIPKRAVEVTSESLKRFGWQQPLVVDKAGVLIVGHTRLQAAKALGLTKVPVIFAENLTEEEVRAYRIADNRTHDFTSWDFPALASELEGLREDFGTVLALEDWRSIVEEFDAADQKPDVPADVAANAALDGFSIVVVFGTKQEALDQEQQLLGLPGVLDIRHKHH